MHLSACGGSGQGLDESGRPWFESNVSSSGSENLRSGSEDSVFNDIQSKVLTPSCATSGCHSGTSAPLGLTLETGKAYAALVERPSSQVNGLMLVEPSNPDASYLLAKLEGRQDGGLQMPVGKPPINSEEIALIRQWILDGAAMPVNSLVPESNVPDPVISEVVEVAPNLADIQIKIFNDQCVGCHSGDVPAANLNLVAGNSFVQLVARPSTVDPQAMPLVSIGDPQNSFLIDKLRGRSLGVSGESDYRGLRMPVSGDYLAEDQILAIEQWITSGANEEAEP